MLTLPLQLKCFMLWMASLWKSSPELKRLFYVSEILCTKRKKREKTMQSIADLQWTTSLHLSSIALSGMNGFSERHVKYFPSSSTTGMNVRTLNDWLPVSENCGMKNDLKIRSERRRSSAADGAGIKLLSMRAHEVLQSTEVSQLRSIDSRESEFIWKLCSTSKTVIVSWLITLEEQTSLTGYK